MRSSNISCVRCSTFSAFSCAAVYHAPKIPAPNPARRPTGPPRDPARPPRVPWTRSAADSISPVNEDATSPKFWRASSLNSSTESPARRNPRSESSPTRLPVRSAWSSTSRSALVRSRSSTRAASSAASSVSLSPRSASRAASATSSRPRSASRVALSTSSRAVPTSSRASAVRSSPRSAAEVSASSLISMGRPTGYLPSSDRSIDLRTPSFTQRPTTRGTVCETAG